MIKIPVTYIPSMNHYIRHSGVRHYRSDVTRKFEAEVVFALKQGGAKVIPTKYLLIVFVLKRKGRDTDNLPKVFIDILAKHFNFNDNTIDEVILKRIVDKKAASEEVRFMFLRNGAVDKIIETEAA
jgi:Holliday junction resolvase RusA-like endonuclease